jgi:hypothetical protein
MEHEKRLRALAACEAAIRVGVRFGSRSATIEGSGRGVDAASKINDVVDAMAEVHRRSLALFWSAMTDAPTRR